VISTRLPVTPWLLAHRAHADHLEPGVLGQADGLAGRPHVHVGGDVGLDEGAAPRGP
jgi:hypothetical protein